MYIWFQYITLPKVSSIMGPGVACWFYPGVPIWIPVAVLAATSKCLRFFQISGLGEYLVLLVGPFSDNENKYQLAVGCPLEFGHKTTFHLHSYKYINFLALKFNFVTEALNCYICCIWLFSCHGIFRNENIDVTMLLMLIILKCGLRKELLVI